MNNWNMNSESTKILKIEIGNRTSKIWKTIKLKSNERQSGMGVEHRKKRKIQTCVSVAVFPMFFDYFWIRSQILPFVFNLIICPSSICCPLLYFLFLISFRFSNLFCFVFSILRQNIILLRWRANRLEFWSQCRIWFGGPRIRRSSNSVCVQSVLGGPRIRVWL